MKKSTPLADVEGVLAAATDGQSSLLDFVRKAAFGVCARVDGDECCFFVKEIENFCVTCHARELLDEDRVAFRDARASDASKEVDSDPDNFNVGVYIDQD